VSAAQPVPKMISALVVVDASANAIPEIHGEIVARLEATGLEYEMIYLLGSSDRDIRQQLEDLLASEPRPIRVLQFALPVTEAAMLRGGAQQARGELLATFPACYETDLSVFPALWDAVAGGADMAFAARTQGTAGISSFQSHLFNKAVAWATGLGFRDIASRTRLLRKSVLEEIPLYGDFHRYLPVLAERSAFRVREIPASEDPRATTPLLRSPLTYLWRALDMLTVVFITRFTRYPLRLFGGVGAVFAASGAVILFVIGVQRILGTPLANRPILVVATLLLGLGVQGFAIGLLGELQLYFSGRRTRDYRIAAVLQSDPPALPAGVPDPLPPGGPDAQ